MGRRPNARQRANQRLAATRARATALPPGVEEAPRVPLAGFEDLYEITRSGHLYSRRAERFIQHAYYNGTYIRLQVGGEAVALSIPEAVEASWAAAPARLYRVDVPAVTVVVYARDPREAANLGLDGARAELRDGRGRPDVSLVAHPDAVPDGWLEAMPYAPADRDDAMRTVAELLASSEAEGRDERDTGDDSTTTNGVAKRRRRSADPHAPAWGMPTLTGDRTIEQYMVTLRTRLAAATRGRDRCAAVERFTRSYFRMGTRPQFAAAREPAVRQRVYDALVRLTNEPTVAPIWRSEAHAHGLPAAPAPEHAPPPAS
jgi:hypothetical protein